MRRQQSFPSVNDVRNPKIQYNAHNNTSALMMVMFVGRISVSTTKSQRFFNLWSTQRNVALTEKVQCKNRGICRNINVPQSNVCMITFENRYLLDYLQSVSLSGLEKQHFVHQIRRHLIQLSVSSREEDIQRIKKMKIKPTFESDKCSCIEFGSLCIVHWLFRQSVSMYRYNHTDGIPHHGLVDYCFLSFRQTNY